MYWLVCLLCIRPLLTQCCAGITAVRLCCRIFHLVTRKLMMMTIHRLMSLLSNMMSSKYVFVTAAAAAAALLLLLLLLLFLPLTLLQYYYYSIQFRYYNVASNWWEICICWCDVSSSPLHKSNNSFWHWYHSCFFICNSNQMKQYNKTDQLDNF